MWTHNLLHFLLVFGCLTLQGQTAKVQLSINPDSAPRAAAPASAVFTADVISAQTPSSVTLCLVDHAGAVLSTHGDLRDDGVSPDQTASDKKYTLLMQIPVDKVGMFKFIARAQFDPPVGQVDSAVSDFASVSQTPVNAEGDLWVEPTETINYVSFSVSDVDFRRVKVSRSDSPGGPWVSVHDVTYQDDGEDGVVHVADPDETAPSSDRYYKVELYDSASVLTKTYSPVAVPAYGDQDRLLRLVGVPLASQIIPTAKEPGKKKSNSPQGSSVVRSRGTGRSSATRTSCVPIV